MPYDKLIVLINSLPILIALILVVLTPLAETQNGQHSPKTWYVISNFTSVCYGVIWLVIEFSEHFENMLGASFISGGLYMASGVLLRFWVFRVKRLSRIAQINDQVGA